LRFLEHSSSFLKNIGGEEVCELVVFNVVCLLKLTNRTVAYAYFADWLTVQLFNVKKFEQEYCWSACCSTDYV
jgi:hypothetical protein